MLPRFISETALRGVESGPTGGDRGSECGSERAVECRPRPVRMQATTTKGATMQAFEFVEWQPPGAIREVPEPGPGQVLGLTISPFILFQATKVIREACHHPLQRKVGFSAHGSKGCCDSVG
jgi:hypothetical protein